MFTAVSGISSYQTRLNVIGNNLANLNTPGFKAERVNFSDLLSQSLGTATEPSGDGRGGTNPMQLGFGVRTSSIQADQTQGILQSTRKPTDLAVQGNGFFMLTDGEKVFYSRAGAFTLDATGDLVDPGTGYKVVADGSSVPSSGGGTSSQNVPAVNIPLGSTLLAEATTEATMVGNLDASAATSDVVNATMRVFDSLGVAHDLRLTLTKTATALTWDYDATLGSTSVGTGTLVFTTSGAFDAAASTVNPLIIATADLGTGAAAMSVDVDFAAVTQAATTSSVNESVQNGSTNGILESFSIGQDGRVTGIYSNGRRETLAQIALASFANPAGLVKLGDNVYAESVNSGLPQGGQPGTGGRGVIVSGALEGSNVDLAATLAEMLITQRGFQANSRVITAADQLIQDLLSLTR
jgi:flagellar hook protein FlgE